MVRNLRYSKDAFEKFPFQGSYILYCILNYINKKKKIDKLPLHPVSTTKTDLEVSFFLFLFIKGINYYHVLYCF